MMPPATRHYRARCLPRRVVPFPSEQLSSYLHRLSEANGLPGSEFDKHITHVAIPDRETVHDLTGLPERTLIFALPELRAPDDLATYRALLGRPMTVGSSHYCPSCAGMHGRARPVRVWATHEQVLCRRHRIWTGGPVLTGENRGPPIGIASLPDVLAAHRRHQRLIVRFGREQVRHAFEDASYLVHEWHTRLAWPFRAIHARWAVLEPNPGRWYLTSAICRIAEYPVTVALTTVLADPAWRKRLLHMDAVDQYDAIGSLTETVTEGAVPGGVFDRLLIRRLEQRRLAPPRPAETVIRPGEIPNHIPVSTSGRRGHSREGPSNFTPTTDS
ncbi:MULTISPECIES: TniQ family protein [Rhodococcus]|uniref:TniQ family protein n=1 Tax=Rhodococcus TaxID=1827 RepID=UPI002954BE51|nr:MULTISPECIES: TniQ family protein [Rhodococcus]MDV7246268.1 TniQ family protein [Rhodococcus oxybenzonivorans]MDV7337260.1 TniQ family protein [Rhodococcus oxybenzonivorans]MDV8030752.1 TniQ family protein [Rhodococcus sp. IEGM 27]MDV8030800.1 TniQ family protein [Rhodococcus sp. IEGM 27]